MLFEERLARLILSDGPPEGSFTAEFHDDRQRDLVAAFMETWGIIVELHPKRPLMTIYSLAGCESVIQ